jgi:phenylacetate-coenzyme A ligase PaaK-like adenylate-forming protein
MRATPLEDWIVDKSGIMERKQRILEEYQLQKIKQTLYYAKENSRFYGELLSNINVDSINSFDDFIQIPFTYPHQVRQNSLDFLCIPQREIKRIVTLNSSGTSGDEKRIYFSEQDLNLTIDFFKIGMRCLTDKSDKVMVLLPGNTYGSIGDLLKKALEMSNIICINHGVVMDPEKTAKSIVENDITCLVGIPMQVLYLSRLRSDLFKNRIKKVLLSTDYVPEVLVRELTSQYGCKVFTHYGMTEMGYGGGVECQALNGYHMREADLYFEIVNPDTGEVVPDGQSGEVVFSTLTRQAMPLIRYRTGDLASFDTKVCACGTFIKTMKKVSGRIESRVKIGEYKYLYLRDLDETILNCKDVLHYKACMTEEGLLKIEIASENKRIKPDIERSLHMLLHEKFGCKIDFIVLVNPDSNPEKIANSMVKRKIHDFRNTVK